MKTPLPFGIIVLVYGIAAPVSASQEATLSIQGKISPPTCNVDVVSSHFTQECGKMTRHFTLQQRVITAVRGVVTEVVAVPEDGKRKIILSSYD